MKRTIVLLLTLALMLACLAGCAGNNATVATAAENDSAAAHSHNIHLDYEALYALYEPDEIVMTVGERNITWGEYFYYLYMQATQIENHLESMAEYGTELSWEDPIEEGSDETFLEAALESAEHTAWHMSVMTDFAKAKGFTLNDESLAAIEELEASDIEMVCGEGATHDDFVEYLSEQYMPYSLYHYMNVVDALYTQGVTDIYGEGGKDIPDEEALAWLEENGYMSADHIMFSTMDMETYEPLDEVVNDEKLIKAQDLADELMAIEDDAERLARFRELKEEFDDDIGKEYYPDGYTFAPGTMVSEFEDAVKSHGDYEVCGPIETEYGYHVIMTLPFNLDAIAEYGNDGEPQTCRYIAAMGDYATLITNHAQTVTWEWKDGYEAPDLLAYLIDA